MIARCTRTTEAHPRSRGENAYSARDFSNRAGSSPLTRGKPARRIGSRSPLGLIPAHAGKTAGGQRRIGPSTAHPRSRGENTSRGAGSPPPQGSSPLTRGKLLERVCASATIGLIPAHAGKTSPSPEPSPSSPAHPRSRGENRKSSERRPNRWGSSPLTRGKLPARRRDRLV